MSYLFAMIIHLFCNFHFVIGVFGVNDTYIHYSDDETDQYFPSDTVHYDVNDDFQFPWTHENNSQQPETLPCQQSVTYTSQEVETSPSEATNESTSHEPKPLSLENINKLFIQQFEYGITYENQWSALKRNPKDRRWNNLCDQMWHNKGRQEYIDIECTAEERLSTSVLRIWMQNGLILKADYLKCSCPSSRIPVTDSNHHFLVVRHDDNNYFTLIYVKSTMAIIHGFVQNIQFPFTETLFTATKYYYTDEAREFYKSNSFVK